MGGVKEKYIEDHQNGFISGSDRCVCEKHFEDSDILKFIKDKGDESLQCSFCDEDDEAGEYKKISWDSLMERIMVCITKFYDDPANGLGFQSSEGGYFGDTYSTEELLTDVISLNAEYEIIQEISCSITQDTWTEAEFYGETYDEILNRTWEIFSNLVKYKIRYIFNDIEVEDYQDISQKPSLILEDISKFIEELNLVKKFPDSTSLFSYIPLFYRARQHKKSKIISTCDEIGPAPKESAGANRFSAEGISLFYGSEDEETAIKEIIDRGQSDEQISVGQFLPIVEFNLIDLRNIPSIGFFDAERINLIEPARFLRSFVENISKKFDIHAKKRIEYVPSQIVTEYFRHVLSSILKKTIHGIIYKSIQNEGKDCYAIFAEKYQCADEGDENEDTLLVLKRDSIKKYNVSEIK